MRFWTKVSYTPKPWQLAEDLWEMNCEDQAQFLESFFLVDKEQFDILKQMDFVTDSLRCFAEPDKCRQIAWYLEELADRIREDSHDSTSDNG